MDVERPRPLLTLPRLLTIAALLAIAGPWLPIWECSNCRGTGKMWEMETWEKSRGYALTACGICRGSARVNFPRKGQTTSGITTSLIHDNESEETFRRISRKLEDAQTLRVRFKIEDINSDGMTCTSEGTLLLKRGGKLRLQYTHVDHCRTHLHENESLTVSDGAKVVEISRTKEKETGRSEKAAPPLLTERVLSGLIRAGIYVSQWTALEGRDPKLESPVDSVTQAPGRGYLSYRRINTLPDTARLWFDPATDQPLVFERAYAGSRSTDTFQELSIDADLPDSAFTLP